MSFGPFNGPLAIVVPCLLPRMRSNGGLQNRNARFDSSVPRPEDPLYKAKYGALEPIYAAGSWARGPLQTAPDRCSRRVSVYRTVHWSTA